MQAIETLFKGDLFRSRLEAKWAFFFHAAGIVYEYEPEGFKSKGGEMYLPDFYLPKTTLRGDDSNKGVYIEIKPNCYAPHEVKSSNWFDKPLVLYKGLPDENSNIYGNFGKTDSGYECWVDRWDNYMGIWICDKCKCSKIEFMGGSYNNCQLCKVGRNDHFLLTTASICARIERF